MSKSAHLSPKKKTAPNFTFIKLVWHNQFSTFPQRKQQKIQIPCAYPHLIKPSSVSGPSKPSPWEYSRAQLKPSPGRGAPAGGGCGSIPCRICRERIYAFHSFGTAHRPFPTAPQCPLPGRGGTAKRWERNGGQNRPLNRPDRCSNLSAFRPHSSSGPTGHLPPGGRLWRT